MELFSHKSYNLNAFAVSLPQRISLIYSQLVSTNIVPELGSGVPGAQSKRHLYRLQGFSGNLLYNQFKFVIRRFLESLNTNIETELGTGYLEGQFCFDIRVQRSQKQLEQNFTSLRTTLFAELQNFVTMRKQILASCRSEYLTI